MLCKLYLHLKKAIWGNLDLVNEISASGQGGLIETGFTIQTGKLKNRKKIPGTLGIVEECDLWETRNSLTNAVDSCPESCLATVQEEV